MSRITILLTIFLPGIMIFSCAREIARMEKPITTQVSPMPFQITGKESWQIEWEKTLNNAQKKERKVIVVTIAGSEVRRSLSQGFKNRYGIDTEWVAGMAGAQLLARLAAERRAGIFLADAYISGSTTMITQLKPQGILDAIPPLLMLPEVTNPSLWYGGKIHYVDKESAYILPFVLYVSATMFINYNIFKAEEIKSYKDLLKPQLKGQIFMGDPTIPSAALRWFRVIGHKIMGFDFLRELTKQDIAIHRDERLIVDWVSKGRYPIGIGVRPDPITEYQRAGAPLRLITPIEGTWLTGGPGVLGAISKSPHPNARKIFINWLLSKEGQTIYSKANNIQSARIDVDTDFLDPLVLRKPGITYFVSEDEEFLIRETEDIELVKQIFGPLLRK